MEIALQGSKVHEILDILDSHLREALGKGYFPHGSHSDNMTEPNLQNNNNNTSSSTNTNDIENTIILNNSKILFKYYLNNYSILPRPPVPDGQISISHNFINIPKNKRELYTKEKLNEEKLEKERNHDEIIKLNEKNQKNIEYNRANMKKFQINNQNNIDDNSDNSDNDDIYNNNTGTLTKRQSFLLAKKRKKNNSVFHNNNSNYNINNSTEEIKLQIEKDRLNSIICGITNKNSLKFQNFNIPISPIRTGGIVKLVTSNDKKRCYNKPFILESEGLKNILIIPTIRSSLNINNIIENNSINPVISMNSNKKPSLVQGKQHKNPSLRTSFSSPITTAYTTESTLLEWSGDRLQSTILEHSTTVAMEFHNRIETQRLHTQQSVVLLQPLPSHEQHDEYSSKNNIDEGNVQDEDNEKINADATGGSGNSSSSTADPYLYGISHYLPKKKRYVS